MEREDFTSTEAKAKRWQSRTRETFTEGGVLVRDFMWRTGRWYWLPHREHGSGHMWNLSGGPAHATYWMKTYWLSMGWSTIEVLRPDDPVDVIQNGGRHGGA